MTSEAELIVQLPRDSAVDRNLRADLPPSLLTGEVVLDHLATGEGDGSGLGRPERGEVVLSVLSPEALRQQAQEVRDVVRQAATGDKPLVILVEAAEYLRQDELDVVLDAARRAHRQVILRLMADA